LTKSLSGPNPQYTADLAQANQSVKKLAKLKFERAVFSHGETLDKAASQAIAKLAAALSALRQARHTRISKCFADKRVAGTTASRKISQYSGQTPTRQHDRVGFSAHPE
jgi:hypothetical protein